MSGADNRQLQTFASFFVHNFQFVYDTTTQKFYLMSTRKILNDRKDLDNETADNDVSDDSGMGSRLRSLSVILIAYTVPYGPGPGLHCQFQFGSSWKRRGMSPP